MATRKMKRYDDGGVTEGTNSGIDDDTRARAMKSVQGMSEAGMMEKEPEANFKPTPKASAPKASAPKAESKSGKSTQYGASERNIGSSLRFGKDRSTHPEYPEDYKKPAKPDVTKMSLSERSKMSRENARSGGTKTDTRSVSERLRSAFGMKSGGMTASKRADGIASKGKTRGKMC